MMNYRSWLALTLLSGVVAVAGCGKSAQETKPSPPPAPKGTVFDGVISQEDRVRKGTEEAMQKNKEKLEQSLKQNDAATPTE